MRVLSPEERALLLEALPLRLRLIAQVLYFTGARVSEILTVRSDAVREDGAMVELRLYGKGRKERTARIPRSSTRPSRRCFFPVTFSSRLTGGIVTADSTFLVRSTGLPARPREGFLGARAPSFQGNGSGREHASRQGGLALARPQ